MAKYSVLTFIFNKYEKLREVENKDDNVEYICVTDDENLKSTTWKIIIDKDLNGLSPFCKCFSVRYNPFKYVSSDICVRIDGSIKIKGNLNQIVDDFEKYNYDSCLMIHPYRNNLFDEYNAWISYRQYPIEQAKKCIEFISKHDYNFNYKGMFQQCFVIEKKNKINLDIDRITYAYLKYLSNNENDIERLDQTILSFVINKYFDNLKVMPISQEIFESGILEWYGHNTESRVPLLRGNVIEPYLFNKPIEVKKY